MDHQIGAHLVGRGLEKPGALGSATPRLQELFGSGCVIKSCVIMGHCMGHIRQIGTHEWKWSLGGQLEQSLLWTLELSVWSEQHESIDFMCFRFLISHGPLFVQRSASETTITMYSLPASVAQYSALSRQVGPSAGLNGCFRGKHLIIICCRRPLHHCMATLLSKGRVWSHLFSKSTSFWRRFHPAEPDAFLNTWCGLICLGARIKAQWICSWEGFPATNPLVG